MTRYLIHPCLASQWARSSLAMKKAPPAKQWFGFLQIPEGKSGRFAIRHRHYPVGTVLKTASARTAIFAGHAAVSVAVAKPGTIVHELCEGDEGIWMTDLPIEQAQIDAALEPVTGRVLIGGLGLGYATQMLAHRKGVTEVVTIEKSPDVLALVAKHVRKPKYSRVKLRFVEADLHEWLQQNQHERFDWAFYDIWAPDGERVFFDTIVPLRKQTGEICHPERVLCWNEDVMRGQLLVGLTSKAQILANPTMAKECGFTIDKLCEPITGAGAKFAHSHNAAVPFFRAIREGRIKLEDAPVVARHFVQNYGVPGRLLPC